MKKTSLIFLPFIFSSAYADVPVVIDHSLYPQSAAQNNSTNTQSTSTLYELMGRLEQMQSEVQQLTGKIDEQANRIDDLKKHQGTMYSDFDERLQNLENKTGGVTANPTEAVRSSNIAAKEIPTTKPSSVIAPTISTQKTILPDKAVDSPTQKSQADRPQDQIPDKQDPDKKGYFMAYDELRSGHTLQSIEQFKAYLSQYPTSEYANNAQYWLGEAYRVNQDNASEHGAGGGHEHGGVRKFILRCLHDGLREDGSRDGAAGKTHGQNGSGPAGRSGHGFEFQHQRHRREDVQGRPQHS